MVCLVFVLIVVSIVLENCVSGDLVKMWNILGWRLVLFGVVCVVVKIVVIWFCDIGWLRKVWYDLCVVVNFVKLLIIDVIVCFVGVFCKVW